ncbi:hypothetical protein GGR25_001853 [Kaistia hirudinis]|uniref:Uncharacterized protein n=1 Tax=Kaistia hirudinis TaxID=1293440 RepID=A0A840ANC8_9HYPH|nr:hypothetical protein [Kaistia hirudinis]MBB3930814.1 hypothetical protein [Kaistia hirudinis]MBN9017208.1 hypothetical protein [Hyphomicrobiales bacterium]
MTELSRPSITALDAGRPLPALARADHAFLQWRNAAVATIRAGDLLKHCAFAY